jgi:LPXTG-motif cell wall-anchored protein
MLGTYIVTSAPLTSVDTDDVLNVVDADDVEVVEAIDSILAEDYIDDAVAIPLTGGDGNTAMILISLTMLFAASFAVLRRQN